MSVLSAIVKCSYVHDRLLTNVRLQYANLRQSHSHDLTSNANVTNIREHNPNESPFFVTGKR